MIRTLKNIAHLINAFIVNLYYGFPSYKLTTIGVTGTDGKTTTTHIVYEMLKKANYRVSMMSTIYAVIGGKEYETGFHTTTPNPWFLQKMLKIALDAGDKYVVLEVTSHGLDQSRVWGIPFKIGILTNVTHEHIDYHGTYNSYLKSKVKLLTCAETAIINREDKSYQKIRQILSHKVLSYGINSGDITWKKSLLKTTLPGNYNKLNILAAASAARQLGVSDSVIKKAISQFTGISGRYEKVTTKYGFNYVIDFAHTPNAFKQLLSTVRCETTGRIIHVFGCTGLRDHKKRPIMGAISEKLADITIITEDDNRTEDIDHIISQIKSGIKRKQNVYVYKYRQNAINYATSIARRGDTIVLAGKGHEKTILRGTTDYPWSEREAIKKALQFKKKMK